MLVTSELRAQERIARFIDAMGGVLVHDLQRHSDEHDLLLYIQSHLPLEPEISTRTDRTTLPVTRKFQSAIAQPCTARLRPLREALEKIEPLCSWQQNPGYSRNVLGDHFMDNYGYFQIIGPAGLVESSHLAVGVLLLGENLRYPEHAHPALEIYYPVCGVALWSHGGSPPRLQASGELVYHAANEQHAMETRKEPLVALYIWSGDVVSPAELTAL